MRRCATFPTLALLGIVSLTAGTAWPDTPAPAADWKFDTIHLKTGAVLRGLIVDDLSDDVRFLDVRRKPGRATVIIHTKVERKNIAKIERLPDEERRLLKERIDDLEQDTPQAEKEREGGLELQAVPWNGNAAGGLRYTSDFFTLTSNAPEEIMRRAALRLEQIYAAYARFLPPRHQGGQPTSVMLIMDVNEYYSMLRAQKQPFLNLAFFDPTANRIVCGTDLKALGDRLADVRKTHKKFREELDNLQKEYTKLYKGKELARVMLPVEEKRKQLVVADAQNNLAFNQVTQTLFATLYHEAFHAYLTSFVYPTSAGAPPRWLNEGLAQIFETALLEAGELRVGHADAARLVRAQDALKKGELVPLADLLKSGPKQFMLVHVGEKQASDRHYLTSWALAFHVTFERKLLGSAALDKFVQSSGSGDAKAAFEELVGQPLPQFEAEFRKYLQRLQADGTVGRAGK